MNGAAAVPRDWLAPLVTQLGFTRTEWRLVVGVLALGPISVRRLARRLRPPLDYGAAKRGARGLIRWHILESTADGLVFQPDASRWNEPAPAARARGGPAERASP